MVKEPTLTSRFLSGYKYLPDTTGQLKPFKIYSIGQTIPKLASYPVGKLSIPQGLSVKGFTYIAVKGTPKMGSFITKPPTTWSMVKELKGTTTTGTTGTTMLRFQPKYFGYAKADLRLLDFLEGGYRQMVYPKGGRLGYYPRGQPPVVDVLKGFGAGAAVSIPLGGIATGIFPRMDIKLGKKLFPRFEPTTKEIQQIDLSYRPWTTTIPYTTTIGLSTTASTYGLSTQTLQLQKLSYKQLTQQITRTEPITIPTGVSKAFKATGYSLPLVLPKDVYGRGRPGFDLSGFDLRYRFREFKLPSIKKILKGVKL